MINGNIFVAGKERRGTNGSFTAVDPATGLPLPGEFGGATLNDLEAAATSAAAAFETYRATPVAARALFLECIADAVLSTGADLVERCVAETGYLQARVEAERTRTVGQLRLFASVLRDGSYLGARIEAAFAGRKPLPRPDLRLVKVPLGPVAVYAASNFPLAFSVAGGDTASALAAGCPVIVKAHPAHPGTSEIVARAVTRAVAETGLPEGVFSMLHDSGNTISQALAAEPHIAAVGFTGSRKVGTLLTEIGAKRPTPIPVYAEMSSINPVVLMPGALREHGEAIAASFVEALTLGSGQFCTNPGLIIAVDGPSLDSFVRCSAALIDASPAFAMLSPRIAAGYRQRIELLRRHERVRVEASGSSQDSLHCAATLFSCESSDFMRIPDLHDETFGASALLVRCRDLCEVAVVLQQLEGQLTASLHAVEADFADAKRLLPLLQDRAGRLVFGGFGTGVEVGHAMVHGGPYPATSDGRSTSVGSMAIERFLRPVSFQNFPDALLPDALREKNPLEIARQVFA